MKNIIKYIPYIVVVLPQLFITNYILIIITTVLIGAIFSFYIQQEKTFLKVFVTSLISFLLLYFIFQDRVQYVVDMLGNLSLPKILALVIFPVFSALNTSILFNLGNKITGFLLSYFKPKEQVL